MNTLHKRTSFLAMGALVLCTLSVFFISKIALFTDDEQLASSYHSSPTVSMSVSTSSIPLGSGSSISWTSGRSVSCNGSNAWSGAKALSASELVTPTLATSTYKLTCTSSSGRTASAQKTIYTYQISSTTSPLPISAPVSIPTTSSTSSVAWSLSPGRPIPDTLYGVTTESVSNISALVTSLHMHTKIPITRIVFQGGDAATVYDTAVTNIRGVSYVMGELLDSSSVANTSVASYTARAREFVSRFGNKVDIWEVGNELNGEWLGAPNDIMAKAQAAYDVVKKENASLNLKAAITFNYWPSSDCYSQPWENTETFARSLASSTTIANGVDYVFLSFYETACSPRAHPTVTQVAQMFTTLKTIFPNAKVGFGEIGAQGKADGLSADPTLSEKQTVANTYYGMHNQLKSILGSRYVGGYFWWYYYQDAVPYNMTNSMWPTIENLFTSY